MNKKKKDLSSQDTQRKVQRRVVNDFEFFCKFLSIQCYDYAKPPLDNELNVRQFTLRQHQKELIAFIERKDIPEKIVLKCRQIGATECLLAYCLWKFLYHKNQKILYTIAGKDRSDDCISKIQLLFSSLTAYPYLIPKGVKLPTGGRCKHGKNVLQFQTITDRTTRSGTYSLVIADEFAFVMDSVQAPLLSAIRPSSPLNRVIISTPAKENDIFHKLCEQASHDGSLFCRNIHDVAEDWFHNKENAKLWVEWVFKNKPKQEINREYLCQFKGAATNTIWGLEDSMLFAAPSFGPVILSLDLGWSDDTCVLFARILQGKLYFFDELITKWRTV